MRHMPAIKRSRHRGFIGFWQRTRAMAIKEFHQLRRDRVSCALIILAPLAQTLLYGYAVNTTPRHLPTAALLQEQSDVGRSVLKALENSGFFDFTRQSRSESEVDRLLENGTVKFAIEMPAGFERALRRGNRPKLLLIADGTDPIATNAALGAIGSVLQTALQNDRGVPPRSALPFDIRIHARYNPAGINSLNIVPGLVGTLLTMTMVVFTALSVTRETERSTMEGLLAKPIKPIEIMLGKIIPYVFVGLVQAMLTVVIGSFALRRPDTRQHLLPCHAECTVYHFEFVDRLFFLDHSAQSIAGFAALFHVHPAEHVNVRFYVSYRGHAEVGTMGQ